MGAKKVEGRKGTRKRDMERGIEQAERIKQDISKNQAARTVEEKGESVKNEAGNSRKRKKGMNGK